MTAEAAPSAAGTQIMKVVSDTLEINIYSVSHQNDLQVTINV
jgi:hypothetical protein